jgi:magnesium chelatase family protein
MKSKVHSCCHDGNHTEIISIESSFTRGFTGIHLIGNVTDVCRDGKERAKTSLENLGIFIPDRRILINLTPAHLKKDACHFDLPIALTLFMLLSNLSEPKHDPSCYAFAAELSLCGELRPVRGIISFVITALKDGMRGIVVARSNLRDLQTLHELGIIKDTQFQILGFADLRSVLDWVTLGVYPQPAEDDFDEEEAERAPFDYNDMYLTSEQKKLAVCIGAGLHSVLLRGAPGTGKSMFAMRLPSILPTMPLTEHLEALQITSSMAPKIPHPLLKGVPPFRAPHHQASAAAVLGSSDTPGEISLAHGGILFLDEFAEFRRDLIESLREPLEAGIIHIARAQRKVSWHSRITLVAATNNCPCGWFGSSKKRCNCPLPKVLQYQNKLSGPILDRIDIHFNMPDPADPLVSLRLEPARTYRDLDNHDPAVTDKMREDVLSARDFAHHRNHRYNAQYNSELQQNDLLSALGLSHETLDSYIKEFIPKALSTRTLIKVLRVTRTLADMEQREKVAAEDVQQAATWNYEELLQGQQLSEHYRLKLLEQGRRFSHHHRPSMTPPLS